MKQPNYYLILKVDSNASQDEIKSAYKSMAQQAHPDAENGYTEWFQRVNEAYRVLKDPENRARYDRGEQVTGGSTEANVVMNRLAGMFQQIADTGARGNQDIIDTIRKSIVAGRTQMEQSVENIMGNIASWEKMQARITYKGDGVNLFFGVLDQKISMANEEIKVTREEIKITGLALKMLDDYECSVGGASVALMGHDLGGIGAGTTWTPG